MFDPEIKEKFIEYKHSQATLPDNYLNRLFEDTEQIECDYQIDVADWDEPLIIEFCKSKQSSSLHSLVVMVGRLSEYADYIKRLQNKTSANKYYNITSDILKTCVDEEKRKKRFISKRDFYNDLNILENAVDKFVLTALFEGIKGKGFEQIWRLELKNINRDEVILHNGKKIDTMDYNLYFYAHESAEAEWYYTYGKTDTAVKMIGSPDQIIKLTNKKQYLEISDDPVMINRQDKNIFRKFERAADLIGWEEIKPRTLLLSGQIEYTKRIAEDKQLDIEDVVYRKDLFSDVEKRFIKIADKDEFINATKYVLDQSAFSG